MIDLVIPILGDFGVSAIVALIATALASAAAGTVEVIGARKEEKGARRQARAIRQQGEEEARDKRRAAAAAASTQRAQFGAAGLEGIGTPALVSLQSLMTGMEDSSRILKQRGREANRLRRGAKQKTTNATRKLIFGTLSSAIGTVGAIGVGATGAATSVPSAPGSGGGSVG